MATPVVCGVIFVAVLGTATSVLTSKLISIFRCINVKTKAGSEVPTNWKSTQDSFSSNCVGGR